MGRSKCQLSNYNLLFVGDRSQQVGAEMFKGAPGLGIRTGLRSVLVKYLEYLRGEVRTSAWASWQMDRMYMFPRCECDDSRPDGSSIDRLQERKQKQRHHTYVVKGRMVKLRVRVAIDTRGFVIKPDGVTFQPWLSLKKARPTQMGQFWTEELPAASTLIAPHYSLTSLLECASSGCM